MNRTHSRILWFLLLTVNLLPAQAISEIVGQEGEIPAVGTILQSAQRALEKGASAETLVHVRRALELAPRASSALSLALEAAKSDPDAWQVWAYHALHLAGEGGEGPLRANLPKNPHLSRLVRLRVGALGELAKWVRGLKFTGPIDGAASPLLARWAAGLAWDLAWPQPTAAERHAAAVETALAARLPDVTPVLTGLKQVMDTALSNGRPHEAIEAARCLLGLASQGKFQDLRGPKPQGLQPVQMAAQAGLRRAREMLSAGESGGPETVPSLSAMTQEEAEAFSKNHASFAAPGIANSPTGLYRVETSCGHGTLLGTAQSVEFHHRRLAKWFGSDPFEGRSGLVRVVPQSSGLESEGTPYWWAGGFQSGDVTTIKFNAGNIEGLGRTLTHELTHRFDGALHRGIPSWLSEGRAVWTGAAYGSIESEEFVENHASFGTIQSAFIKGYGDERNLERLITGNLEDYRDNYTAGYALFVYLNSWEIDGKKLFADSLARYLKSCATGKGNDKSFWVRHFADGAAGRPKGFDAFVPGWKDFLEGFYWQNPAPWTSRYVQRIRSGRRPGWVYDGRTWHDDRDRAEPWFGQDQAAEAGRILLAHKKTKEAIVAFGWSLGVDEWTPKVCEELATLFADAGEKEAAWVLRQEMRRRGETTADPGPMPLALKRVSRKLTELLTLQAQAQDAALSAGEPVLATVLAADSHLLGRHLNVPPPTLPPLSNDDGKILDLDPPPRPLGLFGWTEDELTGYEERRVQGLWFAEGRDVTVGRKKPRAGQSGRDRVARQLDAFARTQEWQAAGRYVVRARIHCETSYVNGSIVLGYGRRDRNVRLVFTAGDFLFSAGVKDEAAKFDRVQCHLHGLREREGGLFGSNPRSSIRFKTPQSSFVFELFVDGAEVVAQVNGQVIGAYRTPDGLAIEGFIGFASGQGVYRVQEPTVHRRERERIASCDGDFPMPLDFDRPGKGSGDSLQNRKCRGLPRDTKGTFVLWVPVLKSDLDPTRDVPADDIIYVAVDRASLMTETVKRLGTSQSVVLAVPASLTDEERARLTRELELDGSRITHVCYHRWETPLSFERRNNQPPRTVASIFYVDPEGVLRAIAPLIGRDPLHQTLRHWARVFHELSVTK